MQDIKFKHILGKGVCLLRKTFLLVSISCAIVIGGAIFLIKYEKPPQQKKTYHMTAETEVISHSDRPKYMNIEDLVGASDLVFVGTVEGINNTRNLARDPEDPQKEDADNYVEGVDYKVKVNEMLKGEADPVVLVTEQRERKFKGEPTIMDEHYIGLKSNGSYIFFVKKSNTTGRYYSAGDPFFFAIEENKAVLKTTEKDLLEIYEPKDVSAFKEDIKTAR